ncbi:uncharacterized protein LOC132904372 [Amyelois transitella]|uniref:uncharacterized protein LOC132904372 n=1 Tax=Amyelois transitella TaxID=680683 RepID=UPI002990830B|nr:uncharacterized protein LOC132904372 [Amyelois transitella]XP_060810564.1 uncharacterized protein LOC132904372 [Amyelois transitella]
MVNNEIPNHHHRVIKSHVPRTGGLHPGHALLKPLGRMLESAANYPKDNLDHLVYGNPKNFGITYNKTRDRIRYTGFRRTNDDNMVENVVLDAILKLKDYQKLRGQKRF